jgi:hypothetical protein
MNRPHVKIKPISLLVLGILRLSVVTLPALARAADAWADNFDSYATGANLHGMGGWKGWFNDPSYTAFTTDFQARTAPNSVDISGDTDLVHELNATSGLYHFRFYQYIPSTTIGTSYFIMLNQYDDAGGDLNWSVQIRHAGLDGLVIDDGTGASTPIVRNQWVEVCLEIDLDNDTQAYYYNGQLLYSGTWSQHISGGGMTSIAAVSLFANGSASVFYDDMSLGPGDCSTVIDNLYLPVVFRQ